MSDPRWDVLCLGEALVEFQQDADSRYIRGLAGDACCVALAVARMGGSAAVATRIGADAFGDQILRLWAQAGIETQTVRRDAQACTGVRYSHLSYAGYDTHIQRDGTAVQRLRPGDVADACVGRARIIHTSGATSALGPAARALQAEVAASARQRNSRVSYAVSWGDAAWSEDDAVLAVMPMIEAADILFVTHADAARVLARSDPAAQIARLLQIGPGIVVLRMANGTAWVATSDGARLSVPFDFTIVDASGAEEAFVGTFLAGLTAGLNLATCGQRAVDAAAHCVARVGSAVSIPKHADLAAPPQIAPAKTQM